MTTACHPERSERSTQPHCHPERPRAQRGAGARVSGREGPGARALVPGPSTALASLAPLGMTIVLAGSLAAQWIPQQSGTNAEFRGLSVVNANVVWASGSRGRVAHTTDGGTTWTVDSVAGATRLD